MKRWLRRLVYALIVLIWFVVMLLPIAAFQLAQRGEIRWGQESGRHVRVFLLQASDAEGVGVEVARPQPDNPLCAITTVSYFMWVGEGQNSRYCLCNDGTMCEVDE